MPLPSVVPSALGDVDVDAYRGARSFTGPGDAPETAPESAYPALPRDDDGFAKLERTSTFGKRHPMSKKHKSGRPAPSESTATATTPEEQPTMTNPTQNTAAADVDFDDSSFVEEPIGFPPYWEPEPGRRFVGTPIAKDTSDPTMTRYVIQAGADHNCQRGKKDEQVDVVVRKNEFFSISEYSGLPLERFFGSLIVVTAVGKRAHKPGKTIWEFQVKVSPTAKKLLDSKRMELASLAQAAFMQAQLNPAPKAKELGDGKTIDHAAAPAQA